MNTGVIGGYPMEAIRQQPNSIIVQQVIMGPDPLQVTCSNCQKLVMSTTTQENGACAALAACAICLICCPCFWLVLVLDSCKDVTHSCPSCGHELGRFKRL